MIYIIRNNNPFALINYPVYLPQRGCTAGRWVNLSIAAGGTMVFW